MADKNIEILKIARTAFSTLYRSYVTETEILGTFSSEEEVHKAINSLGLSIDDFDYLSLSVGDVPDDSYGIVVKEDDDTENQVVIYWESYALNEIADSYIWEEEMKND